MFKDFLDNTDKIFKLVCGAGNEYVGEVERLCALYSLAGCNIFDICAKPEILSAAKKGLEIAGIKDDRYICVSVGMRGDPHILKAKINEEICSRCGACERICLNEAIHNCLVNEAKCIGCSKCLEMCHQNAVAMYEKELDLKKVLPPLVEKNIDCIEFHATSDFDEDIDKKWGIINSSFDGILSICIDRLNLGNKQVLNRINKMIKDKKPYSVIIQADGIPMSGCDDEYKTTLQAAAMAEIIQNSNMPVYIFISGGTNSKTKKLADLCGLEYKGIAVGSYARAIVRPYINRDDFYSNKKVFNEALDIAKKLVEECTK